MTILVLDHDNRVLSAGWYLDTPENAIVVEDESSIPEGNLNDYLYVDGQFIHDPLPVVEAETSPSTEDRIDMLEHEKKVFSAQIKALSDRNDFLEECIAEMACILYA